MDVEIFRDEANEIQARLEWVALSRVFQLKRLFRVARRVKSVKVGRLRRPRSLFRLPRGLFVAHEFPSCRHWSPRLGPSSPSEIDSSIKDVGACGGEKCVNLNGNSAGGRP